MPFITVLMVYMFISLIRLSLSLLGYEWMVDANGSDWYGAVVCVVVLIAFKTAVLC